IDCGKSSLVVIDADRHGAIDGVALLMELMGSDLTVFGCPIVKTAGDGLHLYFAQPESEKFGNRRGALPTGIDVRGQGGYVIAPGSRRINGASWELISGSLDLCALKDTSYLPQLPEFLGNLIRKGKAVTAALAEVQEIRLQDNTPRNRGRNYAAKALRTEAERLAGVIIGQRNNTLNEAAFRLGRFCAKQWVSEAEVTQKLIEACQENGLYKENGKEVLQTISSGLRAGRKAPAAELKERRQIKESPQAAGDVPIIPESETDRYKSLISGFIFDGDILPKPPPELVKGLVPASGICFIGGQSGAGKTFIAVDLATSLASGIAFFSHKIVQRVGVAILAGEGAHTLASRISVAREKKVGDKPLPIAWLADVPNLANRRELNNMIQRLRCLDQEFRDRHGFRLGAVICDTLAACFAIEDENDNSKAAEVLRSLKLIADQLNLVVIPIHHYGKAADTGLRGASAWHAGSDVVLSVQADRDQISGTCDNRRLSLAKSRYAPEGLKAPFELCYVKIGENDDGEEEGACFVEPKTTSNAPSGIKRHSTKLTRAARIYFDVLSAIIVSKGKQICPLDSDPSTITAVDRADIKQEFYPSWPAQGSLNPSLQHEARRKAFVRGECEALRLKIIATREIEGRRYVWPQ
ncbi:MAG: AAA family ATPase, partial [Methylocystis sp.]